MIWQTWTVQAASREHMKYYIHKDRPDFEFISSNESGLPIIDFSVRFDSYFKTNWNLIELWVHGKTPWEGRGGGGFCSSSLCCVFFLLLYIVAIGCEAHTVCILFVWIIYHGQFLSFPGNNLIRCHIYPLGIWWWCHV